MDDLRLKKYTEQLKVWRKAVNGKSSRELCRLTAYFDFGDLGDRRGGDTMKETTFSRAARGIYERGKPTLPWRSEAKFNLYTLLGIYYLLGVLKSQAEIKQFLEEYEITTPSNHTTWDEIWQRIEKGVEQGRKAGDTDAAIVSVSTQPGSEKEVVDPFYVQPRRSEANVTIPRHVHRRWWVMGGLLLLLLIVGLSGFLLIPPRSQQTPTVTSTASFSSACLPAVDTASASFLPAQGYSLHQVAPNAPITSILSNQIRAISINPYGLWVGYGPIPSDTRIDGVSYFERSHTQWIHCLGLPLTVGQTINGFAFNGGDVFIAIDGGSDNFDAPGVARLSRAGWRLYTRKDRLPSNVVYSVYVDKSGTVWATTYEGVARLVDDRWEPVYSVKSGELPCNAVHQMLDDNQGNRWFALAKCGVSRVTPNGQWTSYYTDVEGLKNARALAVDDQSGVWVATDGGGLLRFYNGQWKVFTTPQLPSHNVQDVKRDKFGRIWIATNGGVAYTSDYGQTWIVHSTLSTQGLAFGCPSCNFDETHLWLIVKDKGLGHVRIPPTSPTVRFVSTPAPVILHPGEKYTFSVEVEAVSEGLHKSDGDSLRSNQPEGTDLFGAWPVIEMSQDEVALGQKYTFSNIKNPITAPSTPGKYRLAWRVWQGRRFASDTVWIEFEVDN